MERMLENRRTRTSRTRLGNSIKELENAFVADGFQTRKNMRDLKSAFNKTDDEYMKMLMGFAKIYKY